ncbi:MAG TPA: hypothetical protein VNT25_05635 [Allosphingosinicella sp.]|nr:hypothetical protein [Allosphingosinicella sp.]
MPDQFSAHGDSVSAPGTRALAVVPHDVNALADIPKALFVGTGGTIVMRGAGGGTDATFKNVPDGSVIPFRAHYVRATGTTAADIVALY